MEDILGDLWTLGPELWGLEVACRCRTSLRHLEDILGDLWPLRSKLRVLEDICSWVLRGHPLRHHLRIVVDRGAEASLRFDEVVHHAE